MLIGPRRLVRGKQRAGVVGRTRRAGGVCVESFVRLDIHYTYKILFYIFHASIYTIKIFPKFLQKNKQINVSQPALLIPFGYVILYLCHYILYVCYIYFLQMQMNLCVLLVYCFSCAMQSFLICSFLDFFYFVYCLNVVLIVGYLAQFVPIFGCWLFRYLIILVLLCTPSNLFLLDLHLH